MGDSVFSERPALRYAGDFTWNSMSGRSVRLKSVPVQSLSELERARLQEVAFYQLQQDCDLGCQITIPKGVLEGQAELLRWLPGGFSPTVLPRDSPIFGREKKSGKKSKKKMKKQQQSQGNSSPHSSWNQEECVLPVTPPKSPGTEKRGEKAKNPCQSSLSSSYRRVSFSSGHADLPLRGSWAAGQSHSGGSLGDSCLLSSRGYSDSRTRKQVEKNIQKEGEEEEAAGPEKQLLAMLQLEAGGMV